MTNKQSRFSIPRAEGVTNTHVALGFGARFYDELAGGIPDVLMPTIQAQLGLSFTQVAMLRQVLDYVAAMVEPVNGILLDVWPRRWMMGFGAAMIGLSLLTMGIAPTVTLAFVWFIIAYIFYGMGTGPLAHTGDVVVVEAYPDAPDRAFARSTLIDTIGALLAPLSVTLFIWQGLSWQVLLMVVGAGGFVYSVLIIHNGLPAHLNPTQSETHERERTRLLDTIRTNLRVVIRDQEAIRWLTLLFVFGVLETPMILKTVWLAQEVGMSQVLIGLYVTAEMGVGIVSLVVLDQWRQRVSVQRVLQIVTLSVALLYPLWLLTPGIWPRIVLMIPLTFAFTMFWPILKASSLASVPGKAGSVTALTSLFGLIPLPLLFGLLADGVGMTMAMLGVHLMATIIIGLLVFRR
ncbi:MAG: MFS transporter [Chloroflexota bacterium]